MNWPIVCSAQMDASASCNKTPHLTISQGAHIKPAEAQGRVNALFSATQPKSVSQSRLLNWSGSLAQNRVSPSFTTYLRALLQPGSALAENRKRCYLWQDVAFSMKSSPAYGQSGGLQQKGYCLSGTILHTAWPHMQMTGQCGDKVEAESGAHLELQMAKWHSLFKSQKAEVTIIFPAVACIVSLWGNLSVQVYTMRFTVAESENWLYRNFCFSIFAFIIACFCCALPDPSVTARNAHVHAASTHTHTAR